MLEIDDPAAGSTPVKTPISDDRTRFTHRASTIFAALTCSMRMLKLPVCVRALRAETLSRTSVIS